MDEMVVEVHYGKEKVSQVIFVSLLPLMLTALHLI